MGSILLITKFASDSAVVLFSFKIILVFTFYMYLCTYLNVIYKSKRKSHVYFGFAANCICIYANNYCMQTCFVLFYCAIVSLTHVSTPSSMSQRVVELYIKHTPTLIYPHPFYLLCKFLVCL